MNKIKIFFLKVQAYLAFRARVIEARSLFAADGHRRFIIPFTDGTMEVRRRKAYYYKWFIKHHS